MFSVNWHGYVRAFRFSGYVAFWIHEKQLEAFTSAVVNSCLLKQFLQLNIGWLWEICIFLSLFLPNDMYHLTMAKRLCELNIKWQSVFSVNREFFPCMVNNRPALRIFSWTHICYCSFQFIPITQPYIAS
jgi:hypothetical protein